MTFKEFKENLIENAPVFEYKNKKIIPTSHSTVRQLERLVLSQNDLNEFFKRVINEILSKILFYDKYEEYLFYSKEFKQGIVFAYRKDKYSSDNEKQLIIITVLPPKRSNPKEGTKKIIVEDYITESNEVQEYLNELLDDIKINESSDYDIITKHGIDFVIIDNKIHNLNIDVIEIP